MNPDASLKRIQDNARQVRVYQQKIRVLTMEIQNLASGLDEWLSTLPPPSEQELAEYGVVGLRLSTKDNLRPVESVQLQLPGVDWSKY